MPFIIAELITAACKTFNSCISFRRIPMSLLISETFQSRKRTIWFCSARGGTGSFKAKKYLSLLSFLIPYKMVLMLLYYPTKDNNNIKTED